VPGRLDSAVWRHAVSPLRERLRLALHREEKNSKILETWWADAATKELIGRQQIDLGKHSAVVMRRSGMGSR